MPASVPPAKICIACGQDCAHRARTKDSAGRYTCEACATAQRAVSTAPPKAVAVADDDIIPFLEEESIAPKAPGAPCPQCARPLAGDVIICLGCGFNRQTGRSVTTAMEEAEGGAPPRPSKAKKLSPPLQFKCKDCGYDLKGLNSGTCPECGTVNHIRSTKRERELAESKKLARKAWIAPVIMFVVGLVVTSGIVVAALGESAVPGHLMLFGLTLIIGLVVYLLASLLWIGFDEPLPMTVLRLAGSIALGDIGYTLVGLLPYRPLMIWAIPTIIYCLILSKTMEIDYEDAVIVALITGVVRMFTVLYIMSVLGLI